MFCHFRWSVENMNFTWLITFVTSVHPLSPLTSQSQRTLAQDPAPEIKCSEGSFKWSFNRTEGGPNQEEANLKSSFLQDKCYKIGECNVIQWPFKLFWHFLSNPQKMEPGTTLLMRVGLNSYMFVFQPGTGQTQTVEWGLFLQARNSICLRHPLATIAVPTFPNCFKARSIMSSIVLDDRKAHFQIRTAKPTKTIAFPYKVPGCWWQTCLFSDHSAGSFGKFGGQACLRALNISLSPCPPLSTRTKKQPL